MHMHIYMYTCICVHEHVRVLYNPGLTANVVSGK